MENLDEKAWVNLSVVDIAHYTQLFSGNMPSAQSRTSQLLPLSMPQAPAPVPLLTLVINIMQRVDPAAKFIKGVKWLPDNFPMLKKDGKWQEWKKSIYITLKAQMVSEVLDGTYVPTVAEETLFLHKQTYMLAVLKKNC